MGLNDAPYWISWFIYYFFVNTFISVVCGVLFQSFLFPKSSIVFIILWVFLYGMSLFSFAVLVSSILQRPLIASIVVTLFHFLTYFLTIPIAQPAVDLSVRAFFSFIPNIAMGISCVAIGKLEISRGGLNYSTLWTEVYSYQVGIALISFIANFFIQFLLGLYLDNVLPKEFGKRQHPCFMFQRSYWFGSAYVDQNELK